MSLSKKRKKRRHTQAAAEVTPASEAARETSASSERHPRRVPAWTTSVPTLKRFGAYAIDWALGGVVTGAPAVLLYSAVTRRTDFYSDLYVFEALGHSFWWGVLAGVLCIVAGLFYYAYVPARLMPGQTVGKRLLGLEIRMMDGSLPSLATLALRYGAVGFLLEGAGFVTGRFIRELVTLITRVDVATPWSIAALGVTIVSALLAFYHPHHRAIHDYVAGTRVVARVPEE